jgi:hypothetical protein
MMPSRRSLLLGALAGLSAGCAAPTVRTPKEEIAGFPLVDVHSHVAAALGFTGERLIQAMDTAGIARAVVLGWGAPAADLARRHPDRIVAAYGGPGSFGWRQQQGEIKDGTDPREVERIGAEFEAALGNPVFRGGFGEVVTHHVGIPATVTGGPPAPPTRISPESPLILRILELAGRADVPVNVHCEDYGLREMTAALRARRRTRVVWAHTGSFLGPAAVRDVLRDHPNVVFDLSAKNQACCPRGYTTHPLAGFRTIDDGWRQLFETDADRFLVAFDFFSRAHLPGARDAGELYRTVLSQLTPATARRLGYENAERIYRLPPRR